MRKKNSSLPPPSPTVPPPALIGNPEENPYTARGVPYDERRSCARRFAEVEERLRNLELTAVERHLQVLELAEKVAERLQDRVRKRKVKDEPELDDLDRIIAIRRGKYHVHEG